MTSWMPFSKTSLFPRGLTGKIELGSIDLKAETGKTFAFNAGQTTIGFRASAEFKTGLGVFNVAADAIGSLQLEDSPQLNQYSGEQHR